jgi:hypothetical protein
MPAVSWANFNPEGKGGIILKTIYEQPRKLTRDQAVAMPLEDMQLIMLEFVARSGQLLVDHSEQDLQDSSTLPGAKLKVCNVEMGCHQAASPLVSVLIFHHRMVGLCSLLSLQKPNCQLRHRIRFRAEGCLQMQELLKERSGLCCSLVCWTPFKMLLLRDRGFLHVTSTSSLSPPTYSCILVSYEAAKFSELLVHTNVKRFHRLYRASKQ